MQGTVIALRRNGVIVEMMGVPEIGDMFQIYRVENGIETIVGSGYIRKPKGPNVWKINPMDTETGAKGIPFVDARVGDLVRQITA
jgi:hypothetical protein